MLTKRVLKKHELIGKKVEVIESKNITQKGINGNITDETEKTIKIEHDGRERIVAKKGSVFVFTLPNGEKVKINGDEIAVKPEDRIRKC